MLEKLKAVAGLSPRGRGNQAYPGARQQRPGSIPRGRGNLSLYCIALHCARSIPAWAGEPSFTRASSSSTRVYPRVGGGTAPARQPAMNFQGLSPRGRGNHSGHVRASRLHRSIPAWAGEPGKRGTGSRRAAVYPRVGGGTDPFLPHSPVRVGLSPRGRGNRRANGASPSQVRSIPAWAGEPARPGSG